MCRILAITGLLTSTRANKAINACNAVLKDQRDGFGFFAGRPNGRTFGGKYLEPNRFTGFRSDYPSFLDTIKTEWGSIGQCNAFVAHGRVSTNKVCLGNVHPFRSGRMLLVHNGILDWLGEASTRPPFDCDSEQFSAWLSIQPKQLPPLSTPQLWSGYGAFVTYAQDYGLRILKCRSASLFAARRRGRSKGWLVGTRESDINALASTLGIPIGPCIPIPSGCYGVTQQGQELTELIAFPGFGSRSIDALWEASAGITNHNNHQKPTKWTKSHHKQKLWDR